MAQGEANAVVPRTQLWGPPQAPSELKPAGHHPGGGTGGSGASDGAALADSAFLKQSTKRASSPSSSPGPLRGDGVPGEEQERCPRH